MSDFSLQAFQSYVERVKAGNTAKKYVDAAKHFLDFCAAKKLPLDSLPPSAMGHFVAYLQEKDFAPRSVHVYVSGARCYLKWCQGHGMSAPTLHADLPKADRPVPNALRGESIKAYLHECSKLDEPYRTALLLLPFTGLRGEELVSLRLSKSIRKVAIPVKGGPSAYRDFLCLLIVGKGGLVRLVPILLDGVPLFMSYLKNWRSHAHGSDWVFPGRGDAHISTRTIRGYCAKIRKSVPTPGRLTPHVLRDTYTTALWSNGVDLATITKAVGHADVKTTMAHYLDIQDQDVVGRIYEQNARLMLKGPFAPRPQGAADFLRPPDGR